MTPTARRRIRHLAHIAAVTLALLLGARGVQAQTSCTATVVILIISQPCSTGATALPVSITVGRVVQLGVSPTSTALTVPTPADYNAGFVASNGPTVTVRSNASWTLSISAGASTWTGLSIQTEPARTNKPASDLRWSLSAGGTFTPLSTTATTISSGTRTAGTNITVFYRTQYSWLLDTPGTYSLPVIFTVVAP